MTIKELLQNTTKALKTANIESFLLDAQLLLAHALNVDKNYIILNPNERIPHDKEQTFMQLIERRANHEPLQYIINKAHFYGIEFYVDPNVLIPRPDTETLIDAVLTLPICNSGVGADIRPQTTINRRIISAPKTRTTRKKEFRLSEIPQKLFTIHYSQFTNILDIGTGSGAIAIALAKHLPSAHITALDISSAALEIAKLNAQKNNTSNITFLQHDIFSTPRHCEPNTSQSVGRGNPRNVRLDCHANKFARNDIYKFKKTHKPTLFVGVRRLREYPKGDFSPHLLPITYYLLPDLIVSNPPYIPSATCLNLQPEVTDYEPHLALDGGDDGLNFYRQIALFSQTHLAPNGYIALEIGQHQEKQIEQIFNAHNFRLISTHKDLAGTIRVLIFKRKTKK